jgi:hypothetical protein
VTRPLGEDDMSAEQSVRVGIATQAQYRFEFEKMWDCVKFGAF